MEWWVWKIKVYSINASNGIYRARLFASINFITSVIDDNGWIFHACGSQENIRAAGQHSQSSAHPIDSSELLSYSGKRGLTHRFPNTSISNNADVMNPVHTKRIVPNESWQGIRYKQLYNFGVICQRAWNSIRFLYDLFRKENLSCSRCRPHSNSNEEIKLVFKICGIYISLL